jgi:hypothetical protein
MMIALLRINRVPADRAILSLVQRVNPPHVVRIQFKIEHVRVRYDSGGVRRFGEWDKASVATASAASYRAPRHQQGIRTPFGVTT